MKKVPEIIIRSYLRRWPLHLRKSQFNFLSRYSWLKGPLEDLRAEFFPKDDTEKDADESSSDAQAEQIAVQAVQDSKITEIIGAEGLRGQQSTYQIEREHPWLGKRGHGDLIKGIDTVTHQAVVIKYYPLSPTELAQIESSVCVQQFQNLVTLCHPDNQPQEDLRVSWPIDAIAPPQTDDHYFLIMDQNTQGPTLKEWLTQQTLPLAPEKVRSIIGQILQSLMHLHHQPIRLASGQLQAGLVHGNLSLNSVLWVDHSGEDFFYLSDLALWERPLDGFNASYGETAVTGVPEQKAIQKDLDDLGALGFLLLPPQSITEPAFEDSNPSVTTDTALVNFLEQLTAGDLKSTDLAWQAWLSLPPPPTSETPLLSRSEDIPVKPRKSKKRWYLIAGGTLLALVAGGAWWWWRSPSTENVTLPCCLNLVERVPEGKFTYTTPYNGSWHRAIKQNQLFEQGLSIGLAVKNGHKTFELEAKCAENDNDQPDEKTVELEAKPKQNKCPEDDEQLENEDKIGLTIQDAIDQVKERKAAFAVIPLVSNIDLPSDLGYEIIAYDGLAVFVPFSYDSRQGGIPNELDGELSLSDIRQLYTAQINGGKREIGDENVIYAVDNDETEEIFKKEVLQNQEYLINEFEALLAGSGNSDMNFRSLPIVSLLRTMLANFEQEKSESNENVLNIGFASISHVLKQCSVYPLAISVEDDDKAVQPLVMNDGLPITPKTNLCDDKNLYQANVDVFRRDQYPLAYPIAVVFPRDNSHPAAGQKFAEMMRTIEAQQLLIEANLIPITDPFELARADVVQLAQSDVESFDNGTGTNRGSNEKSTTNVQPPAPAIETPERPKTSSNYVLTPTVPIPASETLNSVGENVLPAEPTEPETETEADESATEADLTTPNAAPARE